jgi:hypothetical protein
MSRQGGERGVKDTLLGRIRRRRKAAKSDSGSEWERRLLDESALDFSPEELREFLDSDRVDVEADPEFKERLRQKLWKMVRLQQGAKPPRRDH